MSLLGLLDVEGSGGDRRLPDRLRESDPDRQGHAASGAGVRGGRLPQPTVCKRRSLSCGDIGPLLRRRSLDGAAVLVREGSSPREIEAVCERPQDQRLRDILSDGRVDGTVYERLHCGGLLRTDEEKTGLRSLAPSHRARGLCSLVTPEAFLPHCYCVDHLVFSPAELVA